MYTNFISGKEICRFYQLSAGQGNNLKILDFSIGKKFPQHISEDGQTLESFMVNKALV